MKRSTCPFGTARRTGPATVRVTFGAKVSCTFSVEQVLPFVHKRDMGSFLLGDPVLTLARTPEQIQRRSDVAHRYGSDPAAAHNARGRAKDRSIAEYRRAQWECGYVIGPHGRGPAYKLAAHIPGERYIHSTH